MTLIGWTQIIVYCAIVVALAKPLGGYMTRVFNGERTFLSPVLRPVETTLYGIGQLGMAESLFYFLPVAPRNGPRYVANSVMALVLGGLGCLVFLALGGGDASRRSARQRRAGEPGR